MPNSQQKLSSNKIFIITLLVIFWPLGVFLMWKNHQSTLKVRTLITSCFVTITSMFGVIGYNAPPYISLADATITNNYKTDNDHATIKGSISNLHPVKLSINNKEVKTENDGKFEYRLALAEGNSNIVIMSQSEKGIDKKRIFNSQNNEI